MIKHAHTSDDRQRTAHRGVTVLCVPQSHFTFPLLCCVSVSAAEGSNYLEYGLGGSGGGAQTGATSR